MGLNFSQGIEYYGVETLQKSILRGSKRGVQRGEKAASVLEHEVQVAKSEPPCYIESCYASQSIASPMAGVNRSRAFAREP